MIYKDIIVVGTIESLKAPFLDIKVNLEHTWSSGYLAKLIICLSLILAGVAVSIKRYLNSNALLNWYLLSFAVCVFIWSLWGHISIVSDL